MEFPLRNHKSQEWHHTASAPPDLNDRHWSVIFRNTWYPALHHLKPELLCFPSRLLKLAQMSHAAHLTLSFSQVPLFQASLSKSRSRAVAVTWKSSRQALEENGMKRHYSTSLLYFEDKTNIRSLLYIQKRWSVQGKHTDINSYSLPGLFIIWLRHTEKHFNFPKWFQPGLYSAQHSNMAKDV